MVFASWEEAIKPLQEAIGTVTDQQLSIAGLAGITIAPDTPCIVAASLLRTSLSKELNLPGDRPPKEYTAEALDTLAKLAKRDVTAENEDLADAWLTFFRYQQRVKNLTILELSSGDIVKLSDSDYAEVSSIDDEGRVFLKGGRGLRVWPDVIVSVEARAGDPSDVAGDARRQAENAAALRMASPAWSVSRSDDLAVFGVTEIATFELVDELQTAIMTAADERPIQQFLQNHACLLTALLGGKDRYCIPQKRLGAEYVPDFIIGDVDSLGIRWVLGGIVKSRVLASSLSGGVLQDSIVENSSLEDERDLLVAVESSPFPGGGLSELEHHGKAGSAGSAPLGLAMSQSDRGESRLDRIGRPQVLPMLGGEGVER